MERSRLNGNKNGMGLYELMTTRERIYLKALAAIDKNDFNNFSSRNIPSAFCHLNSEGI